MDSFFENPSTDVPSERFDKSKAPPPGLLMPKTHADRAWLGAAGPAQRFRSATEAAGAAGVVDLSAPSENEGASERSTHHYGQPYPIRAAPRLWKFHQVEPRPIVSQI